MDPQEMFINLRYVKEIKGGKQAYTSKTGVLKKFTITPLTERLVKQDQIWYRLADFDEDAQRELLDMAISLEDLTIMISAQNSTEIQQRKDDRDRIIDSEGVRVYVDEDTIILPIVGNLLPSDSTNAYTVVFKDGVPKLKPILVCWGCHWSELFTGQTKYKNNVFCLASELTANQRMIFADEMIRLKDAREYLGLDQEDKVKKL